MKFLLFTFALFTHSVFAGVTTLDIALEVKSFKAEYNDIKKTGLLHVNGCEQCDSNFYTFTEKTRIYRKGKAISLSEFMNDYWNAKYSAIFLDKQSLIISKINY